MINSFSFATINIQSNIMYQSIDFKYLFNCEKNLYDSPFLHPYKDIMVLHDESIINNQIATKTLLVNICNQNIILNKYPAMIYGQVVGIQIIPELFSANPIKKVINCNTWNINLVLDKYRYITGFSEFQQEIIFCLIYGIGMQSDKSIANYIENKISKVVCPRAVSSGIKEIYNKLCVNSREVLLYSLYFLNFDKYIPNTFLKAGIYPMENLLN